VKVNYWKGKRRNSSLEETTGGLRKSKASEKEKPLELLQKPQNPRQNEKKGRPRKNGVGKVSKGKDWLPGRRKTPRHFKQQLRVGEGKACWWGEGRIPETKSDQTEREDPLSRKPREVGVNEKGENTAFNKGGGKGFGAH